MSCGDDCTVMFVYLKKATETRVVPIMYTLLGTQRGEGLESHPKTMEVYK